MSEGDLLSDDCLFGLSVTNQSGTLIFLIFDQLLVYLPVLMHE